MTWILKQVQNLGEQAGVHLHPHILRHSIAEHLLDKDVDVFALKDFLGHENLQTTQRYINRTRPTRIREAVMKAGFGGSETAI